MGRKKKKRHSEDAPPASPAAPPEVPRAAGPGPDDAGGSPASRWPRRDSPAARAESKPASWIPAERPASVSAADSPQAQPDAGVVDPESPAAGESSQASPGIFARLAGWWRGLTGPGESVVLRAEPPARAPEAPAVEVAPPEPPPPPRPDFSGPVDDDPVSTLETSLRLAAGLEKLQQKLQNRERHVDSLREQRNQLHHQLSEERQAADGRIRTLEEELTGLRSHAEEPAPQLQEALAASDARIQALEAELTQERDNATTAQAALAAQESRLRALEEEIARMDAPIEEALEQLRLEREATLQRMRSLEADLGAAREQAAAAEARAQALETDLNAARARADAADGRAAARDAELEQSRADIERARAELESARAVASEMADRAEKAAEPPRELMAELDAERRLAQELGLKVEELARKLAVAEREQEGALAHGQRDLGQSQQESHRALTQVRDLEAALQQAEQLAQQREAELVSVKRQLESAEAEKEASRPAIRPPVGAEHKREQAQPAPPAGDEASALVVAELYKQALTPLTVLVASADLLVMSLKDPSLKESAQDIKFQTQALMELMKKAAQPPDKK